MKFILSISALVLFYSCSQPAFDKKAEGEKLMQLSRDWSKLAATPDSIEKTLSYWSDNAVVMQPGQQPLKGKDAIKQMVIESYKLPGFRISWKSLSVEIAESGDLAYMIEQNQVAMNDSTGKTITTFNNGVTIWRKQKDGSWKNTVDISTPMPLSNK